MPLNKLSSEDTEPRLSGKVTEMVLHGHPMIRKLHLCCAWKTKF